MSLLSKKRTGGFFLLLFLLLNIFPYATIASTSFSVSSTSSNSDTINNGVIPPPMTFQRFHAFLRGNTNQYQINKNHRGGSSTTTTIQTNMNYKKNKMDIIKLKNISNNDDQHHHHHYDKNRYNARMQQNQCDLMSTRISQVITIQRGGASISSPSSSSPSSSSSLSLNKNSNHITNNNSNNSSNPNNTNNSQQQQYQLSIHSIQGKRPYMEDEYYTNHNGSFVAVMDGHGGNAVSKYLRQNLYARYLQALSTAVATTTTTTTTTTTSKYGNGVGDEEMIHEGENSGMQTNDTNNDEQDEDEKREGTCHLQLLPPLSSLSSPPLPFDNHTDQQYYPSSSNNNNMITTSSSREAKALASALETIDTEVQRISHWSFIGSTAVVVMIHEIDVPVMNAEEERTNDDDRGDDDSGDHHPYNVNNQLEENDKSKEEKINKQHYRKRGRKMKTSNHVNKNKSNSSTMATTTPPPPPPPPPPTKTPKIETKTYLTVANVGDSRAVLSRSRQAIELTKDHKPNDPMERERVERLGGKVIWCGHSPPPSPLSSSSSSSSSKSSSLKRQKHSSIQSSSSPSQKKSQSSKMSSRNNSSTTTTSMKNLHKNSTRGNSKDRTHNTKSSNNRRRTSSSSSSFSNSSTKTSGGVYRINGNLSLSRAIGDRSEKPWVSSKADILQMWILDRKNKNNVDTEDDNDDEDEIHSATDEFVLLASDGLWDVFRSSQEVIDFCFNLLDLEEKRLLMAAIKKKSQKSSYSGRSRAYDYDLTEDGNDKKNKVEGYSGLDSIVDDEYSSYKKGMRKMRERMAKCVVEEALRRGSMDNISAIIVWL